MGVRYMKKPLIHKNGEGRWGTSFGLDRYLIVIPRKRGIES